MGPQAVAHFGQVQGAMTLVDLDGVSAAERDVRPAFACQLRVFVQAASRTTWARLVSLDLGAVVLPDIEGQQSSAQVFCGADQKLESFGGSDGGGQS